MTLKVKCDTCAQWAECCVHLLGEVVETIILPRGWRTVVRQPGGMHTHDAVTFQCPRCGQGLDPWTPSDASHPKW